MASRLRFARYERQNPGVTIRRVVPDFRSDEPAASREFYETLGFELGMDMDWIATFVSPANPTAQVTLIREDRDLHPDAAVEVETSTQFMQTSSKAATKWSTGRP